MIFRLIFDMFSNENYDYDRKVIYDWNITIYYNF